MTGDRDGTEEEKEGDRCPPNLTSPPTFQSWLRLSSRPSPNIWSRDHFGLQISSLHHCKVYRQFIREFRHKFVTFYIYYRTYAAVVDIGANIGIYSLPIARVTHVLAVEPNWRSILRLAKAADLGAVRSNISYVKNQVVSQVSQSVSQQVSNRPKRAIFARPRPRPQTSRPTLKGQIMIGHYHNVL